jgi:hypothetical protein
MTFTPTPVTPSPSSSAPGRVQGDINHTNDLGTPYGCFACVAADYKGIKLSALLGQKGMAARDAQLAFLANTKDVVNGANLIRALGHFGVQTSIHEAETITDFDFWTAKAASECGPTEVYDGALGYTGHVIRVKVDRTGVHLWDPQGSIGAFDLPSTAKQNCAAYWFH